MLIHPGRLPRSGDSDRHNQLWSAGDEADVHDSRPRGSVERIVSGFIGMGVLRARHQSLADPAKVLRQNTSGFEVGVQASGTVDGTESLIQVFGHSVSVG